MWADQYNSYILFYINGILGTVLWMNISKRIENLGATSKVKNVLLKIGTTTLPILIMHNVLIAVVKKVAHMPTGHTIVDIGAAVGIMVVVIALCELVIWAVGKTPLKKPFGVLLCGKW
jgi:fucose 4-O-acetylase-like acetyltransferase